MKRSLMIALVAAQIALGASAGFAAVNCDQVKKYLGTGRTPEEISDTMVVPVEEVKKCQAAGEAQPASAPAPSGGAAPAAPANAPKK